MSSPSARACAHDILRSYPSLDPRRVHVVHNGIDSQRWQPDRSTEAGVSQRHGVDPDRPSVVFVGRITRQKGLPYFLRACAELPPRSSSCCAPAPPTPRRSRPRSRGSIDGLRAQRGGGVVWIPDMLPRSEVVALLSHGTVFACPSVYEPLGIVNLEAMACELRRRRDGDRRHPRGRRRRRDRLARADRAGHRTAPARPSTRTGSWPTSRRRSPTPSPTPSGPRASGWPAGPGPSSPFSWASIGERTLEVYRSVLDA